MTEEPIVAAPPSHPPYVDRSGPITAFGVVQILIALVCLGFAALVVVTAGVMARQPATLPHGARPLSLQQATLSSAVYLIAAVAFAWLGAGSILARRWARTLSLILAWVWLISGILGFLFFLLLGPALLAATPGGAAFGPGGSTVFLGCMSLFLGAFFILLPGAFILFYRSPNVQATFEARDPVPRWTDRCPAPVLALSLGFAFNVLYFPLSFLSTPAFPVFGVFLSGLPGIALRLALAVVCGMLAVGIYKLQPAAWWATLGLSLVGTASAIASFRHPESWRKLYSQMGMPPEQVEMSIRIYSSLLASRSFLVLCGCMVLAALLYLLWVRRYFVAATTA